MALDEGRTGGDGGAGGSFGGAADLLGGAGGAGDAGAASSVGSDDGATAGAGAADGGVDPDWYAGLSEQPDGESAANRDFAKSKGWKSPDDVVKSYREVERAFRENGRVKIPGEGASAEDLAAWNKAIGVPEAVDGYTLPQLQAADGSVVSLDNGLIGALLPKALERGVPAGMMNGLVQDFVQLQLDAMASEDARQIEDAKAWVNKQGDQAKAKLAAVDQAGSSLGLSRDEMTSLRSALGAGRALDLLSRLGEGMAEDVMITGGRGRFSVTGREAQGEINTMIAKAKADPAFAQAVRTKGTPEHERWSRLQGQAGAWAEQERQNAG